MEGVGGVLLVIMELRIRLDKRNSMETSVSRKTSRLKSYRGFTKLLINKIKMKCSGSELSSAWIGG